MAQDLEGSGWQVKRLPLSTDPTRVNLVATRGAGCKLGDWLETTATTAKRLVLNTHLDTVPPFIPPREDADNIYGRGSNETKGQLASIITAANTLAEKNPAVAEQMILLFVVGEEIDHIGMTVSREEAGGWRTFRREVDTWETRWNTSWSVSRRN